MRKRVHLVVLLFCGAGAHALAQDKPAGAQEPPPDSPRVTAASPAARITLGGHLDVHFTARDGALEEARDALNGAAASSGSTVTATSAWAAVRLDAEWDERFRVVLELERLPYNDGSDGTIGDDGFSPTVDQIYLEIERFLSDKITLRLGQFDFDYRLRPHGEPFFFDGDAESFFSGATTAFARVTADRDQEACAGLRLQYEPFVFLLVEFAFVWRNRGGFLRPSDDETIAVLYANAITGERNALFLMLCLAAGPAHGAEVWTVGAGVNHYFGPQRQIELFAEAYGQFGSLGPDVRKSAWAAQAGVRLSLPDGPWGELAVAYRSGDRRPTGSRDQSFQSMERVDRFLVVESAEFGLDWDTNVFCVAATAGYAITPKLSLRGGAGWFAFNENLVNGAGATILSDSDDRIGVELDGTLAYAINAQATLSVRGGVLFGSDVLEAFTVDDSRTAWAVTFGAALRY
jgi:hypothetical protein